MMKATSPAAKVSPVATEAMRASETSTSALMSKAVTSPTTASSMMGTPQRTMAAQAASKGRGTRPKMLMMSATAETERQKMSFFRPPHSKNASMCFILRLLIPMGV